MTNDTVRAQLMEIHEFMLTENDPLDLPQGPWSIMIAKMPASLNSSLGPMTWGCGEVVFLGPGDDNGRSWKIDFNEAEYYMDLIQDLSDEGKEPAPEIRNLIISSLGLLQDYGPPRKWTG